MLILRRQFKIYFKLEILINILLQFKCCIGLVKYVLILNLLKITNKLNNIVKFYNFGLLIVE